MTKLTKTQKQISMLGGLVAVIIGVVIWVSSGGGADIPLEEFKTKKISTDISDDIFNNAEFKKLKPLIALPLTPGTAGRENPFEKIE